MENNKENILKHWIESSEKYDLPAWEALPKLDLYMDQVITLMEQYLSIYRAPKDKLITSSMINNYVKLGVIPKPNKKRYSRIHLAYLIMVCSLKQVLSISVIQKMLPLDLSEKKIEQAYTSFHLAQKRVFAQTADQVYGSLNGIFQKENADFSDYFGFSIEVALTGNVYKILSEAIADQIQPGFITESKSS